MKAHIGPWPEHKRTWKNLWGFFQRERVIKVKTDPWDSWSADHTLAYVIAPVLRDLKQYKEGVPATDPEDGPAEYANDGEHSFLRWEWILDEMIWTFEVYNTDWENQFYSGKADYQFKEIENTAHLPDGPHYQMVEGPNHTHELDVAGRQAHLDRMSHGTYLFGKYYSSLWR